MKTPDQDNAGLEHNDTPGPMQLIDSREVAALLKISPRTVWRLLSGNKLPRPVKIGRNVRWILRDIETWVSNGCPSDSGKPKE